jgi:SAM-dependent methyltransferase
VLLLIYPINAWRDAPLFPTPRDALRALPQHARLPDGARILDAGCGTGAGLLALRRAYPAAELQGLERSWPLCLLAALRCPWARVRPGDMWRANWAAFDMVYLFQRPESMPRAVDKAAALRPGAWLVSLEFEALALQPTASYTAPGGQTVWMYCAPFRARVA